MRLRNRVVKRFVYLVLFGAKTFSRTSVGGKVSKRRHLHVASTAILLLAGGGFTTPATAEIINDAAPNDDRIRITPTDDGTVRRQAIGLLTFDIGAGQARGYCTAFFYYRSAVATAGHCVYNHVTEDGPIGWNTNFRFYPAKNGSINPFNSCENKFGVTPYAPPSYITSPPSPIADYGAVTLNCTTGANIGIFQLYDQTGTFDGVNGRLSGYPRDPVYDAG